MRDISGPAHWPGSERELPTQTPLDVDFGHTDPQWVLPYGGLLTIDGPARRITAHY